MDPTDLTKTEITAMTAEEVEAAIAELEDRAAPIRAVLALLRKSRAARKNRRIRSERDRDRVAGEERLLREAVGPPETRGRIDNLIADQRLEVSKRTVERRVRGAGRKVR